MERLLNYFNPSHYDLNLHIDKHEGTAKGRAIIDGEPQKPEIKLHAKDLTIDRVKVDGEIVKFVHEGEILEFSPGKHLEIDYHFNLNTNMEGAYLSSYTYEDHEELLVSTQFESHYARECFPCIDEPAAKATFDLAITIPDSDDIVISNMLAKSVVENTTIFETTPKMSTYLLAFCIGKFRKKSKTSLHGVKVTTYCTLNHSESCLNYANDIATASLDYYDHKFGIKYPLEKLDQIAIPDFEAGAMENWGLVTYRESCLLADKTTSKTQKEYIATVIAHELSHQWFGDLVTMQWWNNLWLNESFATLMEYVCVNSIHPEYHIFEDFFTGDCNAALNRDAYPGVQAVQQEVDDPAEIATLFDSAIVYAKGAHLMFMLYRLMGERSFFAGLKTYFKTHKYGNTTGDDLWAALQPHADFNVKQFMDAWISQPGFPVITDGEQQRFLLSGATDDTTWPLPKITNDMSGHYIIQLDSPEFEQTLENFSKLNLEQKIRLLLDRSLLSKTSLVSSATLLDLLPKFRHENSSPIWNPVTNLISDLKLFFSPDDPDFKNFQQYIYYIISPQLDRLGLKSKPREDDSDTKLRETILGLALFVNDQDTVQRLALEYDKNLENIDPELRYFALTARMRLDEDRVFDEYLDLYQKTCDPEIRSDLLFALASAKNHEKRLIKLLREPKIVRPQDHLYLFVRLIRNHKTKKSAIDWLYNNWDYLEQLTGDKSIEDYPRLLASVIRTVDEAKAFEDFFSEKADSPVLRRTLKVAKVEIDARLRLLSLDNEEVHSHLKEISKSAQK